MVNYVDRDTVLCISLAARPSNHGVRFHNWLYDKLGLNYLYKAVAPTDIAQAVAGIRGLGIRGAGVSMPYKQAVIPLVDELHPSAARIEAVNTIVNTDGRLVGYNTDYVAVADLLREHEVDPGPSGGGRPAARGPPLQCPVRVSCSGWCWTTWCVATLSTRKPRAENPSASRLRMPSTEAPKPPRSCGRSCPEPIYSRCPESTS